MIFADLKKIEPKKINSSPKSPQLNAKELTNDHFTIEETPSFSEGS
jgi:hypothetical protein